MRQVRLTTATLLSAILGASGALASGGTPTLASGEQKCTNTLCEPGDTTCRYQANWDCFRDISSCGGSFKCSS